MVYVAVVLITLAVVALGAWTARRQGRTDAPPLACSSERLGTRDPRVAPYGPPGSL